jgi:hypothetical protein
VCVCVCGCVCVCVCLCTLAADAEFDHTWIESFPVRSAVVTVSACMYVHMFVRVSSHVCVFVCIFTCVCVCLRLCSHICVCVHFPLSQAHAHVCVLTCVFESMCTLYSVMRPLSNFQFHLMSSVVLRKPVPAPAHNTAVVDGFRLLNTHVLTYLLRLVLFHPQNPGSAYNPTVPGQSFAFDYIAPRNPRACVYVFV